MLGGVVCTVAVTPWHAQTEPCVTANRGRPDNADVRARRRAYRRGYMIPLKTSF